MKSEYEMTEDSENAGETPRGIGGVKMPSDCVERRELSVRHTFVLYRDCFR